MSATDRGLLLCIPGPWKDRRDFVRAIITETKGEFIFTGMILANRKENDHVSLDFTPHDPQMHRAFEIAGQGKVSRRVLNEISEHRGIAYLHFPVRISDEKERVLKFTGALQRCGGFAVKVESAGIAHEWQHWHAALKSQNPLDLYRTFVVLGGNKNYYYSCGMQHFDFPDVEVERAVEMTEAADLMNGFNYLQIVENPNLAPGHTFSIATDAAQYRLTLRTDSRHATEHLYHNANGIWNLRPVESLPDLGRNYPRRNTPNEDTILSRSRRRG
ncbi:MAG TPA: hypothetical protein VME24_12595 [Alphaproteobacteria bacterium]|nr:hypothetical protein [Alphaproteobacteria bacterium]